MEYFKEIKAPDRTKAPTGSKTVFLAGSIDMGEAENWQEKLSKEVSELAESNKKHITLFNPRRDDWDSSWKQEINNTQFFDQVSWELDHIDRCNYAVIFFSKESKAPITLMELGKISEMNNKKVIVFCPEGYHRKGNVDIVCYRKDIPVTETYEEFMETFKKTLGLKDEKNGEEKEEETEPVKESVEPESNQIIFKSLHDDPLIEYKIGEDNTIIVEDFEFIKDSCMMGKWRFMGREVYGGICNESGRNKIKLKIRHPHEESDKIVEFEIRKADENTPESIILSE